MTPAAKCCFVDVCLPYAFHTMVAWRNRHAISTLMVCRKLGATSLLCAVLTHRGFLLRLMLGQPHMLVLVVH